MKRLLSAVLTLALLLIFVTPQTRAGVQTKGCIALTFDDGPSGDLTERLLDGLRARGIHATFFVCGYRVAQYPQTLCRIAQEGHEIGLHSCCHDYMHKMSREAVYDDLVSCMEAVTECCGVAPRLFRPPGGLYSPALTAAAQDAGVSVILWSVDPEDWDVHKRDTVLPRILRGAAPGAIILMHDLSENSVNAALRAVDTLQAEGWQFYTVSELARSAGAELTPGGVYSSFPPKAKD